ncbi:xylosyltransferase oxt-like [Tubulanus polymorphus]|uniref:xylosyltransferase oxt-like n=1 Tax=Tubulanus polymorphus TaxID=672921 RepID=UPI003DA383FD
MACIDDTKCGAYRFKPGSCDCELYHGVNRTSPTSTGQFRKDVYCKEYRGCFKDTADRDVNGLEKSDFKQLTPDICRQFCLEKGFYYAAVQYSYSCFCGNLYGKHGRVADAECNMKCLNSPSFICGEIFRYFSNGNPQSQLSRQMA